ncbi:MAG: MATE family efflux transporter [Peptococcaceae bacterium]|jgi:Na+-driven multidrug efflux pump|nr:MATE family efflux transporter [Peptococcaceae bacterium]
MTEQRQENLQQHDGFTNPQSYIQFLSYIFPSMVTMIFLSFYTTIDGFFASRFINKEALAAINIVLPITCIYFGLAVMLATGASAVISMKLGEGRDSEASSFFSFTLQVLVGVALLLTVGGIIFLKPILVALGSTEILLPYTIPYALVSIIFILPMMLKLFLEYFVRVDDAPGVALAMSATGLIGNVLLDALFIIVFDMGILGAALGTAIAITISAAIGVHYFLCRSKRLKLGKPKANWHLLGYCCYNGSSEMFTEFSTGIATFLFNLAVLQVYGEAGVSAYSLITYAYYFFIAFYFGVSVGAAPVISYNYGAGNPRKMREYFRYSMGTILGASVIIFLISHFGNDWLIHLFSKEAEVIAIAAPALRLFSYGFLFMGINTFAGSLFTAVCNGKISALISLLRSLVFVILGLYLLPRTPLGVKGIWLTVPFADFCTLMITLICFYHYRNIYYPPLLQPENKQNMQN